MKIRKIENTMLRIYKVIISVILLISFANAIGILALTIIRSVHAYSNLFKSASGEELPGVQIFESVDGLLLVLLLLIMSVGFLKLFLADSKLSKVIDLPWLKVDSFSKLKLLLIETILVTLVIVFATVVLKQEGKLDWKDILVPLSIVLFALTIKFVKVPGDH